jgi:23S rRNA pseudouridine1911/1915/1917 synthase
MSDKINLNFIIPDTLANDRLDQAIAKLLPDYSRTQIKNWIESGMIHIDGQVLKGKVKVQGGEQITVAATLKEQPAWEAQEIPLNIVYEDDDILVINKPVGLVVHPGAGNADRTLLNALLHYLPQLQTLPRAGIVHRIDKDTSGLLVVGKTAIAVRRLSQQIKKHTLQREYQAVVHGTMISGGKVDAPIARHPTVRKRMAMVETGKHAVTHYRVTEKFPAHTHLTLQLETGRTHQIRVHMAYIRHPIVGDATYGARVQLSKGMSSDLITTLRQCRRQSLHAFALGLTHPVSGEFMRFEIELPEDMQTLLNVLKEDKQSRTKK